MRRLALATGMLDIPIARHQGKTHTRPTPLLGGVAVACGVSVALLVMRDVIPVPLPLLVGSLALMLLGITDDRWSLDYRLRLGVQTLGAVAFISSMSIITPATAHGIPWLLVFVLWMVWTTNSANLMDNLDGATAGCLAMAATGLAAMATLQGHGDLAVLYLSVAGACLGFLPFNIRKASIFLGDGGTLFLGYYLSALVVWHTARSDFSPLPIVCGTLFLGMPIYDATFATIRRIVFGRAIFIADGSNVTFRLRALGLQKTSTLLFEYSLQALFVAIAFAVAVVGSDAARLWLLSGFVILAVGVGAYLWGDERVDVQQTVTSTGTFARNLLNQTLSLETVIDFVLVVTSYVTAYALRYSGEWPADKQQGFVGALPVIALAHYASYYYFGIYRRIWQFASAREVLQLAQAVVVAAVLSMFATAALYRLVGFSRSVFAIAALLLLVLATGYRLSRRLLTDITLPRTNRTGEPVLIIGAGRGGDLLYREILHNQELGLRVIGFADDDPDKHRRKFHGLPVFNITHELETLNGTVVPRELLISTHKLSPQRRFELGDLCRRRGWRLREMKIELRNI